jgi:hypothetical protein
MPLEGVYETYAKSYVDRTVYWYHTTCKYPGYHIQKYMEQLENTSLKILAKIWDIQAYLKNVFGSTKRMVWNCAWIHGIVELVVPYVPLVYTIYMLGYFISEDCRDYIFVNWNNRMEPSHWFVALIDHFDWRMIKIYPWSFVQWR